VLVIPTRAVEAHATGAGARVARHG